MPAECKLSTPPLTTVGHVQVVYTMACCSRSAKKGAHSGTTQTQKANHSAVSSHLYCVITWCQAYEDNVVLRQERIDPTVGGICLPAQSSLRHLSDVKCQDIVLKTPAAGCRYAPMLAVNYVKHTHKLHHIMPSALQESTLFSK